MFSKTIYSILSIMEFNKQRLHEWVYSCYYVRCTKMNDQIPDHETRPIPAIGQSGFRRETGPVYGLNGTDVMHCGKKGVSLEGY